MHGDEVVKDETDKAAELVRPELWEYPFENLVLEGGGNKGIAYAGLLRVSSIQLSYLTKLSN